MKLRFKKSDYLNLLYPTLVSIFRAFTFVELYCVFLDFDFDTFSFLKSTSLSFIEKSRSC